MQNRRPWAQTVQMAWSRSLRVLRDRPDEVFIIVPGNIIAAVQELLDGVTISFIEELRAVLGRGQDPAIGCNLIGPPWWIAAIEEVGPDILDQWGRGIIKAKMEHQTTLPSIRETIQYPSA